MIRVAIAVPLLFSTFGQAVEPDDNPDLVVPAVENVDPAPGNRVRHRWTDDPEWLHHLLYLPTDWETGTNYPIVFEYPGNQWRDSPGTMEGCELGYGLTGGTGAIWVCLPFVDSTAQAHATTWWGDVSATVAYAKKSVRLVCERFGGDPERVFLAGFSRGSIACGYIGLHDDEIAGLWRGFVCHSHFDGVRQWSYPESDRASALVRLQRLGDRPVFVSQENTVAATRDYLGEASPGGNFTFVPLPGWPHTASWVLHDIPERRRLREWFVSATSP